MTDIILIVIAVELAAGIFLMVKAAFDARQQRHEIYYQLTEIWHAIREQQ